MWQRIRIQTRRRIQTRARVPDPGWILRLWLYISSMFQKNILAHRTIRLRLNDQPAQYGGTIPLYASSVSDQRLQTGNELEETRGVISDKSVVVTGLSLLADCAATRGVITSGSVDRDEHTVGGWAVGV
ncbi:unnamed protein product [Pleuronectes platessa]|uniref:Uncharacterized protein n=1 Tax=Pleuronectes platessa TaxID=8262 RepID=A0A9N7UYV8_PLEPL|nr:unnamed protein product [Pleuronectes platessa]